MCQLFRYDDGMSDAQDTWSLFLTLWLRHKETFHQIAEAHQLTPTMAGAVLRLGPEPLGMRELATRIHCHNSNVTMIAKRLQERKLATLTTDPSDARGKLLKLTAAGQRLRRQIKAELTTPPASFAKLTVTERSQLHHALALIADDH
jgi:DNA-binding MarR family transcriptional regulator